MKKSEREYRNMTLEVREVQEDAPEMIVQGYATTFDQPYLLWRDIIGGRTVEYWEKVDRSAFQETDMADVIMQYDHKGRVFARIKNGTLALEPDEHGLLTTADLGGTDIGRQLYQEIKGGYTDKMSFGFTVKEDEETREESPEAVKYTRTIKAVGKLYDVSAVSIPANDMTELSVRRLQEGVIQQAEAERLRERELILQRERLALRARAFHV